jgi:hypothetical protein
MSLKNLQSVLICLLIICPGFSPYTALAYVGPSWLRPGLTVRIDPAIKNAESGHTFTVNVMVDGAVNLGAFQFDVIFDPAVVTVTNVELGLFLGSTGRTARSIGPGIDNVAGTVTFGAFSFGSNAGPEGAGLLAAVTFTAVGSGTSALNLQKVVVTDTMGNAQAVSVEGGTVTVAAPTSAPTSAPTMTPSPTGAPTVMPTPTSTATATEIAEPVTTVTPTDAATATATSKATITPTALPVATETATPVATAVPTPTAPLTSTLAETSQPQATVTSMPSPTPGAVSSQMLTSTPQPAEGLLATSTTVESLTAAPKPAPTPTTALSSPLCWLPVGGLFLFVAGCILCLLLRRYGE